MKIYYILSIYIAAFLTANNAFAQAKCYQSWSIESQYLTNRALTLKPGDAKDIKFKVTIQRFASQTGSGFETVDFKFEIRRLPDGETDWVNGAHVISQVGEITSVDFQSNLNMVTKEFTMSVASALDPNSTSLTDLKNGDKILLVIQDPAFPYGLTPTSDFANVVVSNSSPFNPPPNPPSFHPAFHGNNICCGNQCVVKGQIPARLVQDPRVTLDMTDVASISWDFCVDGYTALGHPTDDNGTAECTPNPTERAVSYRRILHMTNGCLHVSNQEPIYVSSLTPLLNFSINQYSNNTSNQAYDINISGQQSTTSNASVDFVAGHMIDLLPGARLLPNTHLLVDPTIVSCVMAFQDFKCSYYGSDTCLGRLPTTDSVSNDNVSQRKTDTQPEDESDAVFRIYPNPTTGETSVEYSISNEGNVMLYVYDNLGRVVAILINNQYAEAGKHEVFFNAKDIPAGIYFVKLIADGYSNVEKIIVATGLSKENQ